MELICKIVAVALKKRYYPHDKLSLRPSEKKMCEHFEKAKTGRLSQLLS